VLGTERGSLDASCELRDASLSSTRLKPLTCCKMPVAQGPGSRMRIIRMRLKREMHSPKNRSLQIYVLVKPLSVALRIDDKSEMSMWHLL
jgi:hypothetical protein